MNTSSCPPYVPKVGKEPIPIIPTLSISLLKPPSIHIPHPTLHTIDADLLRAQAHNGPQTMVRHPQRGILDPPPADPRDPQACEVRQGMRGRDPAQRVAEVRDEEVQEQGWWSQQRERGQGEHGGLVQPVLVHNGKGR